jgi:EAL domain-containing protein (putative c-di-GMP-specific phosphodiesterase class I)
MQMEQDLNLALKLGQLVLNFQPIWIRPANVIARAEVIALVSPREAKSADSIHSLAELRCQIVSIGDWVLEQACRNWLAWQNAGINPGFLAINISRIQFRKRFSKRLAEIMATYGIPSHALEQITSVLLDDHQQVAES